MQKYNIVQKSLRELADPQGNIIFNNDSDKPLFVLCPALTMDYTTIIFYPPRGCYFAAAGRNSWVEFSASHDYDERISKSDDVYNGFLKWMRREGIKKDYVPSQLFQWYSHCGGYGSRCHGEIGKKAGTMYQDWGHKINSAFLGNEHVDAMLNYWKEQLEQFQEFAFVLDDWPNGSSPDNTICALKNLNYAIDGMAYGRPLIMRLWEGDAESWANRHLVHIIKRLENGERLFPNLPFPSCVKVSPSIVWDFIDNEAQRERALLRSHLMALLGFPWHYDAARDTIKRMSENKDEVVEALGQEIYEGILANLCGFTETMRRTYPVLEANPLEKATVRLIVQGFAVDKVPALQEEWGIKHTYDDCVAPGFFLERLEFGQTLPVCGVTFFHADKGTCDVVVSFDAGAFGYGTRTALDVWLQPVQEACMGLLTQYEPQRIFCGFGYHPKMQYINQTGTAGDKWHELFCIENPAA